MVESERIMRRIAWWGLAACIVVPGVVMAGLAVADHVRAYGVHRKFARLEPAARVKCLNMIAADRDWRLAGLVRQTLEGEAEREELQAAGYAAMRLGDLALLPLIRKRADEGPDDYTRAMLITYAARLSNRDLRLVDWLEPQTRSAEPWQRAGSAAGLLHLGRIEAGPLLMAAVREGNADIAGFVLREWRWMASPMGQAIGQPMPWLDEDPVVADNAQLDQLDRFWQKHATVTLLNDVLRRLTVRDPEWTEMNRLIRARDHVAKFMQ